MSRKIIFSAFITICLSTVITSAQTAGMRLSFSEDIEPSGIQEGGTVVFTGLENPDMRVFEAIIPATTESECFASRDFSTARPVSPNRARLGYDEATGSYQLKWTNVSDKRDSCRVLLVRESISSGDLAMWQSNYGVGGFAESGFAKDGSDSARGDGSVRPIRYSISLNAWRSSTTLEVKYPGKDGDVIHASFPDSPDRNFVIFEAVLPATTEAGCLASMDFSSAVPADPNRASAIYDPQSELWHLKNSNTGSVPLCHVLLANGDGTVDAADYAVWRTNFGRTQFTESSEGPKEGSTQSDAGAFRTRQTQTTYAFAAVMSDQ